MKPPQTPPPVKHNTISDHDKMTTEAPVNAPVEQSPEAQEGGQPTANTFRAAEVLRELKAKAATGTPPSPAAELDLDDLHEYPELFQPRGIDERHIQDLVRAIKNNGKVDPIVVIHVGSEAVVVDGHHRRQAYRLAEVVSGIPVIHFEGTLEEAVLEAGRANSKAKLTMANQERQNYAWRLVRMGVFRRASLTP